jgi:hypothetical protein
LDVSAPEESDDAIKACLKSRFKAFNMAVSVERVHHANMASSDRRLFIAVFASASSALNFAHENFLKPFGRNGVLFELPDLTH